MIIVYSIDGKPLVSQTVLANKLNVKRQTVQHWIKRGLIYSEYIPSLNARLVEDLDKKPTGNRGRKRKPVATFEDVINRTDTPIENNNLEMVTRQ